MRRCGILLALAAMLWISGASAWAGTGFIRNTGTNQNVMDATVFFDDTTTPADKLVSMWTENLRKTSTTMWKATNGLLRLGRIRYGTYKSLQSKADFAISYTGHANAHCPGLGQSGTRVAVFTKEDWDQEITTLHELGHYIFGIRDEYMSTVYGKNASGAVVAIESGNKTMSFCPVKQGQTNPNNDCLMYYCYQPLYLFCNDDHIGKGDGDTAGTYWIHDQQQTNNCSCWQTIGKYFNYTVPAGRIMRTDDPPEPPKFEAANPEVAFAALIQGDMAANELAPAKTSVKGALKGLRLKGDVGLPNTSNGDHIYVGTAGATYVAAVADADLASAAVRDAAYTAVDGLTTSATAADLEASLSALATDMANKSSSACSRTILLVSTGAPKAFSQALINQLRQADIQVDAVVVWTGNQAGYDNIQALTTATSGSINTVDAAAVTARLALKGRRCRLKADGHVDLKAEEEEDAADEGEDSVDGTLGIGCIADLSGTLNPGTPIEHKLTVDELNDEIIIRLSSRQGGALVLGLKDPSGNIIDLDHPPANVGVDPWEAETHQVEVTVSAPEKGTWTITVDGAIKAPYELKLSQLGESMGSSPQEEGGDVSFPAASLLQLTVEGTQRVMGCQVTARIGCPDGSVMNVTLYDDGDALHGDELANDGVYSNYLPEYRGTGTYKVSYTITNVNGQYTTTRVGGDKPLRGGREAGPIGPAPAFTRVVDGKLLVQDPTGSGARGASLVPPVSVVLSSNAPGQIVVSWADPNSGNASTVIQRGTSLAGPFTEIATVPAGQTTYTDRISGVATSYYYRLVAKTSAGVSSPSAVKSFDLAAAEAVQTASSSVSAPQPVQGLGGGGTGGCFIATAAYGSYLDPHVAALRQFRANVLAPYRVGRAFISFYERVSPPMAAYIAEHPWARGAARVALTPVVFGVEYPIAAVGVTLLGVAMAAWVVRRRRIARASAA